jgi:putative oxidoreductase
MTPLSQRSYAKVAVIYARLALGAAFLSGIADRFGLYGKNVGYGNFENFVRYTAQVNSFMPAFTIRFLAWAATVAELLLGLGLVFGLWIRWTSLASAALLALFGTAMAMSFGFKSPLDYSVFSASAAALLLALVAGDRNSPRFAPTVPPRNPPM